MLELDKTPQNVPLPRPAKSIGATSPGQGRVFLETMLNHAVSELRPRAIVAERLDLRYGGLSPELNRLIANAGRAFLEKKLHDIYEKFGSDIYRVEAAYTSQVWAGPLPTSCH